jgi:hypothetical protein
MQPLKNIIQFLKARTHGSKNFFHRKIPSINI